MLRPKANGFLGSSRAERRRNMRREKVAAVGAIFDALQGIGLALGAALSAVFLLWGLPLLYCASSFLCLALPMRWVTGRAPISWLSALELLLAVAIALVGVVRAFRGDEPVAPVRPVFARTMLGLCWIGSFLLMLVDIWGKA
jgi:hypothetical protein